MSRVLPILFNTDMVRAILDGRKMVTRRIVKQQIWEDFVMEGNKVVHYFDKTTGELRKPTLKAPYQLGDTLYVRETWGDYRECVEGGCGYYMYRADYPDGATTYLHSDGIVCDLPKWHSSIHMPKEAARIFLKVMDVRVERLQDATSPIKYPHGKDNTIIREGFKYTCDFITGWNSTLKKSDLNRYGWDANPWVWVIEFERCEKEESDVKC